MPFRKCLTDDDLRDRICVVVGTRPDIIKQAPLIEALEALGADFFILHTGQHYSYNMDRVFFEDLGLPEPDYKIEDTYKYRLHGEQTAIMLMNIERILLKEKPKLLVITGDANTSLAAALAARKLHIRVAHTESGVRTFDWMTPEEHNRVLIERLSDYLFAPNEWARENLEADNVGGEIFVIGSTLVDALYEIRNVAEGRSALLSELGLNPDSYFLMTMHREENLEQEHAVRNIIKGVLGAVDEFGLRLVFPIHPRTEKKLKELGLFSALARNSLVNIIPPVGYVDFISLLSKARLVLTDSGGIQQEACILGVPCVTFREATEWIETVLVGANVLVGADPERIVKGVSEMMNSNRDWENPFGEPGVSGKIARILVEKLGEPMEVVRRRYRRRGKHVSAYLGHGGFMGCP